MGKRVFKSPACLRSPWQLPQIRQGRWGDFCQITSTFKCTDPQHCIVTADIKNTHHKVRTHIMGAKEFSKARHKHMVSIFRAFKAHCVICNPENTDSATRFDESQWVATAVLAAPAYQRLLEKTLIKLCSCLAISVLYGECLRHECIQVGTPFVEVHVCLCRTAADLLSVGVR